MLLELRDGRIYMELNYGPEKQLAFLTRNTYNGGVWVKIEAARALRNNVETGVLRVTLNGVQEDLMDTIALPESVSFQMNECFMFFGGLPSHYQDKSLAQTLLKLRPFNSFLGQMRAITLSNPGSNSLLNPLYTQRYRANPYYAVEPQCERSVIKTASFGGEAYLEVKAQALRSQNCFLGFSFQSYAANSLILLSTFAGQSDDKGHFYSVALVDGRLQFKFSSGSVFRPPTVFTSKELLNDGRHHTVSIAKSNKR